MPWRREAVACAAAHDVWVPQQVRVAQPRIDAVDDRARPERQSADNQPGEHPGGHALEHRHRGDQRRPALGHGHAGRPQRVLQPVAQLGDDAKGRSSPDDAEQCPAPRPVPHAEHEAHVAPGEKVVDRRVVQPVQPRFRAAGRQRVIQGRGWVGQDHRSGEPPCADDIAGTAAARRQAPGPPAPQRRARWRGRGSGRSPVPLRVRAADLRASQSGRPVLVASPMRLAEAPPRSRRPLQPRRGGAEGVRRAERIALHLAPGDRRPATDEFVDDLAVDEHPQRPDATARGDPLALEVERVESGVAEPAAFDFLHHDRVAAAAHAGAQAVPDASVQESSDLANAAAENRCSTSAKCGIVTVGSRRGSSTWSCTSQRVAQYGAIAASDVTAPS
jgi:hypothetical protein